ncbi:RNA polymerase sigma factor [Hespellia stercorisuis]|uniref:Uncharacterized protein n=1 Tax=Hespellia stercorisuis DSM 15480 TaxID=1121950 RepID=A0A1M6SKS2_9FIRM|nr:hypothetical protein [Hespellia stercorisuis]SHK45246.1 hypothetical protein SAMN02745243_02971 [Hespellia stercorisuis DSM 15480]
MADLDYPYLARLVQKTLQGNSNAFAELYAATYQRQYRLAYNYFHDPYVSQDTLKQLYILVLAHLDELKDPQLFIDWLDQINHQICQQISANVAAPKFHDIRAARLDVKNASILLSSILESCGYEANSMPLSAIDGFQAYRKENYILQKAILVIVIACLLLTPLLFVIPKVHVEEASRTNSQIFYRIGVHSLLRVKSVTATLGGTPLDVYETAFKVYTIAPEENGTVTATVTLENGQYVTRTIDVTAVDTTAPSIVSQEVIDSRLVLSLSDDGSGIDFEKIKAFSGGGSPVSMESFDEATGVVEFDNSKTPLELFIPDKAGNTTHTTVGAVSP